jgi:hypothetical protein
MILRWPGLVVNKGKLSDIFMMLVSTHGGHKTLLQIVISVKCQMSMVLDYLICFYRVTLGLTVDRLQDDYLKN